MIDLIQRAQQGDNEAFVRLFEQSKHALWKAAMAVLNDADDAADAMQDTVIKAWRGFPRFEGRCSVQTWFMRVLLRVSYDLLRKRTRETPYAMGGLSESLPAIDAAMELPQDSFRVIVGGTHCPDRDEVLDVQSVIAQLSADDRLILTLFYSDDCPTREVALILNISEGAARTRLSRARDRFKTIYSALQNEEVEVAQ